MFQKHLKYVLFGAILSLVFILAACGPSGDTTANATPTAANQNSSLPSSTPTSSGSAGTGPIVILSPTPVPGGGPTSQQVVLSDRTLVISSVSKQQGSANALTITVMMTVKNTSGKAIMNESSFFQLVGSEGDTFGLSSNAAASFFGTIASHASRSGQLVFELPTGAASKVRLLYHSEVGTETVFVPLSI